MGYTHYWRQKRDLTNAEWLRLTALAKSIIEASDIDTQSDAHRGSKYSIDNDVIEFNGVGDDSHETFWLTRLRDERPDYIHPNEYKAEGAFNFCKTAGKPYDEIVVAILLKAKFDFDEVFTVSSDGAIMEEDGDAARDLLARIV